MPTFCAACKHTVNRKTSPSVQCSACQKLYHRSCADPSRSADLRTYNCCGTLASLFATPPQVRQNPFSETLGSSTKTVKRPLTSPTSPSANPIRRACRLTTPPPMMPLTTPSVPMEIASGTSQQSQLTANQQSTQAGHVGGPRQDGPAPGFFDRMEKFMCDQSEHAQRMETQMAEMMGKIVHLEERDIQTNARIDNLLHKLATRDMCEIKFSGIPADSQCTPEQGITAILTAIGVHIAQHHVLEIREWTYKPANSNATNQANTLPPQKAYIVAFASPQARDRVLFRTSRLEHITAQSVFGCGGNSRLFIREFHTKEVHELLNKAYPVTKALGYMRPRAINQVVCVRPPGGQFIEIQSEADLSKLVPTQVHRQA